MRVLMQAPSNFGIYSKISEQRTRHIGDEAFVPCRELSSSRRFSFKRVGESLKTKKLAFKKVLKCIMCIYFQLQDGKSNTTCIKYAE